MNDIKSVKPKHSKSKKYKPEKYETIDGKNKNVSAVLFATMLQHPKFQGLTNKQKVLYVYMKLQKFGGGSARYEYKKDTGTELSNNYFVFNWAMANKVYKLYTNNDRFYDDVEALVQAGFIEVAERNTHRFKKNVYKFSDNWTKKDFVWDENVHKNVRKRANEDKSEQSTENEVVRKRTKTESEKRSVSA